MHGGRASSAELVVFFRWHICEWTVYSAQMDMDRLPCQPRCIYLAGLGMLLLHGSWDNLIYSASSFHISASKARSFQANAFKDSTPKASSLKRKMEDSAAPEAKHQKLREEFMSDSELKGNKVSSFYCNPTIELC